MSNSDKSQPKWLTIGQAAKYLGVSRDTLRRWGKKGKIEAVRSPTNRRYYTQKQLDQIMGEKGEKGKAEKPQKKSTGINTWKLIFIALASLAAAAILGSLAQVFFLR